MVKEMFFGGPCPFLTCLEKGPHFHPICPNCGAVRYGNMYCRTCVSTWPDGELKAFFLWQIKLRQESGA